jgi:hypothetical protein
MSVPRRPRDSSDSSPCDTRFIDALTDWSKVQEMTAQEAVGSIIVGDGGPTMLNLAMASRIHRK